MNVPVDTTILQQTIKTQNKNVILQLFQETKVALLNKTNEKGYLILQLIFENHYLKEKDIVELLKSLYERGDDLNIKNSKQETVLHLAVAKRWTDVVDFLISIDNLNIFTCDKNGNTIAHFFIEDERKKFRDLFDLEVGRNEKSEKFKLMECESAKFVEWLISKGFDFDRKNRKGKSALHLSMEYNLHHISLILLQHCQDLRCIDKSGRTLLLLFLEKKAKGRSWGYALQNNCYSDYTSRYALAIVKLLLDRGVSTAGVYSMGRTCNPSPIEFGEDARIVKILIEHSLKDCDKDASTTAMFSELLQLCICSRKTKIDYFLKALRVLVAEGADVNAKDDDGKTPAYIAIIHKSKPAVDFLNEHNADFGFVNEEFGENLLHTIAKLMTWDGEESTFELIKSKGCCVLNARNKDQETPLHVASKSGNTSIAKKLIQAGVKLNLKNINGETPLYLAIKRISGQKDLVELLLENGADVNTKDHRGRRPLHFLANMGKLCKGELLQILLKWGAYVNCYADDKSPFIQAIECECLRDVNCMLEYGGDINDRRIIEILRNPRLPFYKVICLQHWIKFDTAGLPCLKDYEAFIMNNHYEKDYQNCRLELEKLKSTFIDKRTSIFNFLHMDLDSRRRHINNEKLKTLVNFPNLEKQFPQYFVLILASYQETVNWRKLLEPAKQAWHQLTNVALPDICMEGIFIYLKIEDLVSIIEHVEEP